MARTRRNTIILCMVLPILAGPFLLSGQSDRLPPLELSASLDGGYYGSALSVELISSRPSEIFYTLDGSRPDAKSRRYTGPIPIRQTTTLRALALADGQRSSYLGHTYLIGEPDTRLPTICIALPDWVLFDPNRGLFMEGPRANDSLLRKPGANFWSRREMFVHAELLDENGRQVHNSPMGMRLFGGMSRIFPQKSLTLVARDQYGQKKIRYPVFGPDGLNKFKYLVLRNSGSDWGKSHLRDAFMTRLVEGWDMEKQAYRPAHVYINGRYWGLYNIREKINKFFLSDHAEVDKDSIDLLEHHMTLKQGSRFHYQRMRRFIENNDMAVAENFAWVERQMDVDNFIDYQIAQIYFDNRDAGGNIRFWRPQREDGRWRWILYDTDMGFGLHDPRAYAFNSLDFHTDPDGPYWPNPPWSTFLLRKLLENPTFHYRFVNRFADHLNQSFREERVVRVLDDMTETLRPEIGRHFDRWNLSPDYWEMHLRRMRKFALQRPRVMRQLLARQLDLGEIRDLVVVVGKGGTVILNDNLSLSTGRFEGAYFSRVPVKLAARPTFGYRFSHWEHLGKKDSPDRLVVDLGNPPPVLKAVFEPYVHPLAGKLIINEIGPNNPDRDGGDWVEIYNSSRNRVYLKNWLLSDSKHEFVLPDLSIPANDYLVICEDSAAFRQHYPQAFRVAGGLPYGINKRKEYLALYSDQLDGIDSVSYRIEPSDSVFSLSLLLPYLENADPENWRMNRTGGTPGQANPYYLESRLRGRQHAWLRAGVALATLILCVILLRLRGTGRL